MDDTSGFTSPLSHVRPTRTSLRARRRTRCERTEEQLVNAKRLELAVEAIEVRAEKCVCAAGEQRHPNRIESQPKRREEWKTQHRREEQALDSRDRCLHNKK